MNFKRTSEAYVSKLYTADLLSCKQAAGESFADYYTRLKDLMDEVDLAQATLLPVLRCR